MRRPSPIIAAAVLLLLGLAIGLGRQPSSDNSVETLTRSGGPAAQTYQVFAERFGADDLTAVELESDDPDALLDALLAVDAALRGARGDLVITASTAFGAEVQLLTDDDLGGPEAWADVKPRLAASPLNRELGILAPDGRRARAFALSSAAAPPTGFVERLQALRAAWAAEGVRLHFAGSAILNDALEARSQRIARTGLPLVALVCVLVLWLTLRRLGLVLTLLIPVAMVVLAVDRTHGALGGTSNLLTVAARPVTLALLLAGAIHLVLTWLDLRFEGRSSSEAVREAKGRKWPAISLALLTTAVGFGSLGLSDVGPIRDFGLLTAAGLGLGLPVVLLVIPVLLEALGEKVVPPDRRRSRLGQVALLLVRRGARSSWLVIGGSLALTLLGFLSFRSLPTQTHAIEYFGEGTQLRRDHRLMEGHGLGLQSLEILIDGVDPARIEDLERLEALGQRLEAHDIVLNRVDLPTLLREANHRAGGGDQLPNPLLLEQVLNDPPPVLDAFRDDRGVRTTLLLQTSSTEALRAVVDDATQAAQEAFGADQVMVTGSYRLILEAQATLLKTLRDSLIITALVMQLVVLLVLGATGVGWLATLPNALPVAMTFGTMWLLSIPLDLGTSMVAALALGIAVDDTLHFGFACRRQRLADAARATGRGILLSSITIAAGFSTLLLSEFAPTIRFGGLTSLAMLWALLADLLLFPALVARLPGRGHPDELEPSPPFVPPPSGPQGEQ